MPAREQLQAQLGGQQRVLAALGQGHTATASHTAGSVTAAGLAGQLAQPCNPAALQTFVTIIRDL